MSVRSVVALVIVSVALAVPASAQSAATPQPTPAAAAVENGGKLFIKYGCHECHGREGQGAPTSGPRIGPNPLALAAFIRYVRTPRTYMPPYTIKVVSDRELTDMHAYLTARPRPPANALPAP